MRDERVNLDYCNPSQLHDKLESRISEGYRIEDVVFMAQSQLYIIRYSYDW